MQLVQLVQARRAHRGWWILLALALLLVSIVAAVAVGSADVTWGQVWQSIASNLDFRDWFNIQPLPATVDATVWLLRMPRVLTAASVGAGLALCGVVMQSLTRNPLADPYLLGLSSGASLGAVSVMLLGIGLLLPVAAFAGATLALAAALGLAAATGRGNLSPTRTILSGLAVGQMASAATSFIIFWNAQGDQHRQVISWMLGSLAGSQWTSAAIAASALVLVGGVLLCTGNLLDSFAFGDTAAASLGVRVQRTRWGLLLLVALLTGALVSQSGAIGFVGLTLPHAVRLLVGARHRLLLPLSALVGAIFLIWADTLARTVFAPRELPVGIVTAAVGAPVFAALLWHKRGSYER